MFKKLSVMSCCVLLSACSVLTSTKEQPKLSQAQYWQQLQGRWYGHVELEGGIHREWLVERRQNGLYQIHFRTRFANGESLEKVEAGEWGVVGAIYFSIYKADIVDGQYRPVSSKDPSFRDGYEIIYLDDEAFQYRDLSLGTIYRVKRVEPGFALHLNSR